MPALCPYPTRARHAAKWLRQKGFRLVFKRGVDDEVDFERAEVRIDSRARVPTQNAALLHECGHVVVHHRRFLNKTKKLHGSRHKEWVKTKRGPPSTEHKLTIVTDEMGAWDEGWKLRKTFKLGLTSTGFAKIKSICLMSYIKWAAR